MARDGVLQTASRKKLNTEDKEAHRGTLNNKEIPELKQQRIPQMDCRAMGVPD
jgi:hypothetical protein